MTNQKALASKMARNRPHNARGCPFQEDPFMLPLANGRANLEGSGAHSWEHEKPALWRQKLHDS